MNEYTSALGQSAGQAPTRPGHVDGAADGPLTLWGHGPAWLETVHLITTLPAWSRNLTRRSEDTRRSS